MRRENRELDLEVVANEVTDHKHVNLGAFTTFERQRKDPLLRRSLSCA